MNKLAFLIMAWSMCFSASAQFYMSYSAADEDLEALYQNIKTYNPGLYIYNPDFDREAQKIMNELPAGEVSSFTYFTLVSKMCAASNEGHFGLGNWQDTIHSGFLNNTYRYMPLAVSIVDDQLFVWKDYSTLHAFEPGDEIISINGRPAKLILDQLRAVTCTDGRIQTYGDKMIESGFAWKYFLYIEQPEHFLIEIKNREGVIQEHPIEAIFREQQVEHYKVYYGSDQEEQETDESFADFQINDQHAVLTLPSFDWSHIEKHNVKSSKFYKGIFNQLRESGTPNLIIDLRDNTGGRKEFAEDMVPHIMTDNQGDAYLYQSTSWEGKARTTKLPKPKKPFQGRIYVLVNGKTFSSASTLTRYLKEYANAVIIGEETASRYEGYVAGSQQFVTLPNSKLVIKIPRYVNQYPPSKKQTTTNRGVLPDYPIHYSVLDRLESRDKHMEKALELIGKTTP